MGWYRADHDPEIVRARDRRGATPMNSNRIILAVATATRERCERRVPDVDLACWASSLIADGEIDARLIRRAGRGPRATGRRDDVEDFSAAADTQPSRSPSQSASCTISSSSRRCTPEPFVAQSAALQGECRKPERSAMAGSTPPRRRPRRLSPQSPARNQARPHAMMPARHARA